MLSLNKLRLQLLSLGSCSFLIAKINLLNVIDVNPINNL